MRKGAADGEAALAALPELARLPRACWSKPAWLIHMLRALGPTNGAWRRLRFHFGKRATVNFAYAGRDPGLTGASSH